jgi:hypothetical protein
MLIKLLKKHGRGGTRDIMRRYDFPEREIEQYINGALMLSARAEMNRERMMAILAGQGSDPEKKDKKAKKEKAKFVGAGHRLDSSTSREKDGGMDDLYLDGQAAQQAPPSPPSTYKSGITLSLCPVTHLDQG